MGYEISTPKTENIETINIRGNPQQIMGVKQAKTESSYIQSKINHFRKYPNVKFSGNEIAMMFESILAIHKRFHGEELKDIENLKLEIEIIGKIKGVGCIEIYRGFDNNINIRVPIRDKDSGIVNWTVRELKKDDLNRMIHIVKNLPLNEPVSCYEIAEKLGYESWQDLWKIRKDYFRYYYFSLKFLEATHMIEYKGDGTIIRKV